MVLVNTNQQIGPFSCTFVFYAEPFFWVIATVKASHVLKRAWPTFSTEGYTNMKRSWGLDEKVMILRHDLKTSVFH